MTQAYDALLLIQSDLMGVEQVERSNQISFNHLSLKYIIPFVVSGCFRILDKFYALILVRAWDYAFLISVL